MDLKNSIGAWITVGHPQVTEALMSSPLYDWLAIDCEHCSFTPNEMVQIFTVCQNLKKKAFVRISQMDPIEGRKALDYGADGVLIPMVEDPAPFKDFCASLRYPPEGKRGVCLARINRWGEEFDSYMRDFKPIIVPQIESKKGVDNLPDIIDAGVSGVFLGPYDLSASLGTPGQFDTDEFKAIASEVIKICEEKSIPLAIHVVEPDPELLLQKKEEGFSFFAFGTDMICMRSSVNKANNFLKESK